jgi:thioredoxin-like negative regulator of GroEL
MFSAENCTACKFVTPIFHKAAAGADGIVNFGLVRTDIDSGLSLRFQIRILPTFMIVHRSGRIDYKGPRNDRAMLNAAARLIPDKAAPVTLDWATDGRESVILFTDKTTTPPIWAAIACAFHGKVRVGISADPEMMDAFKVDKVPTILFVNKTHSFTYSGRNSFLYMKQYIEDFLSGHYEEPFHFNADFFLPDEYDQEARNFSGYIIMETSADLDPRVKAAKQKFKNNRLKFFYGDQDLPLPFMQPRKVYIVQPQKEQAIVIDSPADLAASIATVFDGTAEWKKFDQITASSA